VGGRGGSEYGSSGNEYLLHVVIGVPRREDRIGEEREDPLAPPMSKTPKYVHFLLCPGFSPPSRKGGYSIILPRPV
jgi:hypothetical protein